MDIQGLQAWIHSGFYRQISHNKYIFNNKKHFPSWNLANILSEWLGNPGKGTLGVKNPKTFLWEPAPDPLEACAFARLGNQSVFKS